MPERFCSSLLMQASKCWRDGGFFPWNSCCQKRVLLLLACKWGLMRGCDWLQTKHVRIISLYCYTWMFPTAGSCKTSKCMGLSVFFSQMVHFCVIQGCDWCTSHPVTAGTLVAWHQRTLGRFQSGGSFLSVSCQGHQTTTHSCPTWIYALLCVNFFPVLILQFGPKHAVLLVWKYLKAAVLSSSFNLFFQKKEKLLYFDLRGVDSCSSTCSYNQLGWRE